jgi:hypothetical protein
MAVWHTVDGFLMLPTAKLHRGFFESPMLSQVADVLAQVIFLDGSESFS